MQLQLISSALNRIPAVNGNYYKELQGRGIIGSLKEKKKKRKKVGQDQHCIQQFSKMALPESTPWKKQNLLIIFTSPKPFLNNGEGNELWMHLEIKSMKLLLTSAYLN